jgi:hypothetical protein
VIVEVGVIDEIPEIPAVPEQVHVTVAPGKTVVGEQEADAVGAVLSIPTVILDVLVNFPNVSLAYVLII